MRDGRFATPRFNAAVDVAHVQKPGAKLLGESAERKKDFSEISAYRNSITRRGNRRHAADMRRSVIGFTDRFRGDDLRGHIEIGIGRRFADPIFQLEPDDELLLGRRSRLWHQEPHD